MKYSKQEQINLIDKTIETRELEPRQLLMLYWWSLFNQNKLEKYFDLLNNGWRVKSAYILVRHENN